MNLTYGVKYIDPWSKSPWSHTDIQRMRQGLIGCQVGNNTVFAINLSQLPGTCRSIYNVQEAYTQTTRNQN